MRILYAVHRYPPHIGGSEEVSRRVVEHLVREGHEVTVATSHHQSRAPATNPDVRQFHLSSSNLWPDVPGSERAEAERYRDLFGGDWDVRFVYAAQSWALDSVWDMIGEGRARDILAPCGYSWLGDPAARPYFDLIEKLLPKFERVVYHSDAYQDYAFAEERGLVNNAVVIPNGTDLPVLPVAIEQKHAPSEPVTLSTIGSHVRSKGHADFLSACKSTGLSGALVAARPASPRERIRGCYFQCRTRVALARNVHAVDGRNRALVERALSDASLFYFPSRVETAPLVILEAMARATPWLSYDIGMVHTLPGGMIVGDRAEAIAAIEALARDPSRRVALAGEGRRAIAERYEWSRLLPHYARLVEFGR